MAKKQTKSNRDRRDSAGKEAAAASVTVVDYAAGPGGRIAPNELYTPAMTIPVLLLITVSCSWVIRVYAGIKGNELSLHQAVFTAANAVSLTGFQQARNPNDYTPLGQACTLLLMLAGILFSTICGGLAVVRIGRMRYSDATVAGASVLIMLAAGLLGAMPLLEHGRGFSDAVYQAISAYGNCGLYLGTLPDANGLRTQAVVLPLALIGGIGVPVLLELVDLLMRKKPLSAFSRSMLLWSAGGYVLIALTLFAFRMPWTHGSALAFGRSMIAGSREAINTRSAGFPFEFASYLSPAAAVVTTLIMLVGAAPGGTAGGINLLSLRTTITGVFGLLKRRPVGRFFAITLLWIISYLSIIIVATLILLITDPEFHLDRAVFMIISALGNVGLSHNPVEVSDTGLDLLAVVMLLGRVLPVMMLWYLVQYTADETPANAEM